MMQKNHKKRNYLPNRPWFLLIVKNMLQNWGGAQITIIIKKEA